jgi:hypothetical protein
MGKAARKRSQSARERIAAQQAAAQRTEQRRRLLLAGGSVVLLAALVVGIVIWKTSQGPAGPGSTTAPLSTLGALKPAPAAGALGPEGVPIPIAAPLAGASGAATGQRVDGISCQSSEQTLFHIHAHLTVFVNGMPRQVPAGIGIPGAQAQDTARGPFISAGTCFYWLHTHAADGIIHIESPVQRAYTLGNFFDEWRQPLGPRQVGPARGKVTAIYDGKVYLGNPRDIPLTAHAQIQLEVGRPLIAPQHIAFPAGL